MWADQGRVKAGAPESWRARPVKNFRRSGDFFSTLFATAGEYAMTMDVSDQDLLQRFATCQDEEAFSALVKRHVNLVLATARRVTSSDDLARDAAQNTFIRLAQQAKRIPREVLLAAWLHRTCRSLAVDLVRSEARRRKQEMKAAAFPRDDSADSQWPLMAPVIDDLVEQLGDQDREIILLRYFQNRTYAAAGKALGLQEQAARKRAERALRRLRSLLRGRGITTTSAALASILPAYAAEIAPEAVAAAVAGAARGIVPLPVGRAIFRLLSLRRVAALSGVIVVGLILALKTSSSPDPSPAAMIEEINPNLIARHRPSPPKEANAELNAVSTFPQSIHHRFTRAPDGRSVTMETLDDAGAIILVTVYRLSDEGKLLNSAIFDAHGTKLFTARYGYSKKPDVTCGKLVEEQMFDARAKRIGPGGVEMPVRRFIYRYASDGSPMAPVKIVLEPGGKHIEVFGAAATGRNFEEASP
ncbi:MAG: sigE 1 [Akkermansiaceae bacterium]|nr:sigE 1 [Akkermansiaceae bacterium]